MSFVGTNLVRAEGFTPPGPGDFNLPPVGPDKTFEFLGETMYAGVTKPIRLAGSDGVGPTLSVATPTYCPSLAKVTLVKL